MDEAVVMDASAVLACIHGEPGADIVRDLAPGALISAVNFAEVISKLIERGTPANIAAQVAGAMSMEVVAVDAGLGLRMGTMHETTQRRGVSLGDRACLALAERAGLPVVTADRTWLSLNLGLTIRMIR